MCPFSKDLSFHFFLFFSFLPEVLSTPITSTLAFMLIIFHCPSLLLVSNIPPCLWFPSFLSKFWSQFSSTELKYTYGFCYCNSKSVYQKPDPHFLFHSTFFPDLLVSDSGTLRGLKLHGHFGASLFLNPKSSAMSWEVFLHSLLE